MLLKLATLACVLWKELDINLDLTQVYLSKITRKKKRWTERERVENEK